MGRPSRMNVVPIRKDAQTRFAFERRSDQEGYREDDRYISLLNEIKSEIVDLKGHLPGLDPGFLKISSEEKRSSMYSANNVRRGAAEMKKRFEQLLNTWKDETRLAASVLEMVTHPAYQQIIGMGPAVVPLILDELAAEPDHWFWALRAITGQDPVPAESKGKLDEMTTAWLKWGQDLGIECTEFA